MKKIQFIILTIFCFNISQGFSQTNNNHDKYKGRISDDVYTKYDKDMYTDELSYLEPKRAKIEVLRVKAAKKAIDSGRCDYVDVSDYSYYTSTKSRIEIIVRCKNNADLYYSEKSLN